MPSSVLKKVEKDVNWIYRTRLNARRFGIKGDCLFPTEEIKRKNPKYLGNVTASAFSEAHIRLEITHT
jgi:hypothetical protein